MILTGSMLSKEVRRGAIAIEPFDKRHVNPNSYNFHLHNKLLSRKPVGDPWRPHSITSSGFLLHPRRLYLAATAEVIGSNHYVVTLLGKSSVGRLGIFLNITADLGHLGCHSRWTLEITVVQPVRIYAGMCIGQVTFWSTTRSRFGKYNGRYHRHLEPVPNRDLKLLLSDS